MAHGNKIGFLLIATFSFLFSCETKKSIHFSYKEFIEGGERVRGRFINDTIRDGVFIHYYKNGDVARIWFYEKNVFKGSMTEYYSNGQLASYALLKGEKGTYQITWFQNGDTLLIIDGEIEKMYYKNRKPEMYNAGKRAEKIIAFDEEGNIKQYKGPLDYLTSKDSADLDKAYPKWKEMVREVESKKN